MSYGLQPSQKDEWKKKHKVRSFMENLALDTRDVLKYVLSIADSVSVFAIEIYKKTDKKLAIKVLLAVLLGIFLVI